jgi:hypothetical protein
MWKYGCERAGIEFVSAMRVHHITYATSEYALAAYLLRKTARRFGVDWTTVYGPGHPAVTDLADRFPQIMRSRRGAGFWLWKPFIIKDALAGTCEGEAVFYTDVAMIFEADPWPLIGLCREHPIVLFEMIPAYLQGQWTKRDCFVMLKADTPEFWQAPQLLGGFQLYRNGPQARDFVDRMCEAVSNPNVLTDVPNVCGLPDLPGFREHRHDQSVLTIMAKKFSVRSFPDPSQWGPLGRCTGQFTPANEVSYPDVPYGQVFYLHRKRNRGLVYWYARYLFDSYLRNGHKGASPEN